MPRDRRPFDVVARVHGLEDRNLRRAAGADDEDDAQEWTPQSLAEQVRKCWPKWTRAQRDKALLLVVGSKFRRRFGFGWNAWKHVPLGWVMVNRSCNDPSCVHHTLPPGGRFTCLRSSVFGDLREWLKKNPSQRWDPNRLVVTDATMRAPRHARSGKPSWPQSKARGLGSRSRFVAIWDGINIMNLPERNKDPATPDSWRAARPARFLNVQELTWISLLAGNRPPRAAWHAGLESVVKAERTLIKEALDRHGQVAMHGVKLLRGPRKRGKQ